MDAIFQLDEAQRAALTSAFAQRGLAVFDDGLSPSWLEALREEAKTARAAAWVCERGPQDAPPLQRNHRADLGTRARALLTSDALTEFVHQVTGCPAKVSFEATCFTYYSSGDYLEAHTDRPSSCLLTMLFYLQADHHPNIGAGPGLSLEVQRAPSEGGPTTIATKVGRVLVLAGSSISHGRPRLWPREHATMLSACFHRSTDS